MHVPRTPADGAASTTEIGSRESMPSPRFRFRTEDLERTPMTFGRSKWWFILQKPYDPFEETHPLVGLAMDVTEEYDWWMGIFARHAGRDAQLADWAREKGVEL